MPSAAFLGEECRWQLSHLFHRGTADTFWDKFTAESLESAAPLLVSWQHREAYGSQLVEQLKSIVEPVRLTNEEALAKKRQAKAAQRTRDSEGEVSLARQLLGSSTPEEYTAHVRRRDDSLAM